MSIAFLKLSLAKSGAFPLILTAAIPIWAGDTAAIFAGKAFGKHKLAPSISPNKTWEGSIANLLAAVGAAAALGYFLKYPMDKMLLLGVSCGVLGQVGDLFESYLKRQAGVKDSGNLLPGHGGVFDRLDSLLMTAPFSYWILSSFLK
jgi:phosphatidate cytidylyltransferase